MSQIPLTPLEHAVLDIVAAGRGRHGWHAIATRLSSRDVPRSPGLMDVLAALQQRGLVVRLPAGDSATWAATATGAAALRAPADPLDALIAEIARGPSAAVPAVQRLAAAGTPLEETGAAVFDRADPRAPDAGFALAFALSLLDPPARAARVRALVAADEHARLATLFAGWAPLRVPDRGAAAPYLPEPAWTEALAAALDGPYPAARDAAALLALATDRLEALRDRLRARLDPAAPAHRAVLDALGPDPTGGPTTATPTDWTTLRAATDPAADADALAELVGYCDQVPRRTPARLAGVVASAAIPAARLALTAGLAALTPALAPLVDRGLAPLIADPAMPERAAAISAVAALGLLALARAAGCAPPAPDDLADRWLAFAAGKLAVLDEGDRRTAALTAAALDRPARLPAFDRMGPLGKPRPPEEESGMAYFAFARRLAEGGEAPATAWAAVVDRFPLSLASDGATWLDLALAAIAHGRLAGRDPAAALEDLRARTHR